MLASFAMGLQAPSTSQPSVHGSVQQVADGNVAGFGEGSFTRGAGGLIPWLIKKQNALKQA